MASMGNRLLRAGLLLGLCAAQALAQNAPASVSVDANANRHAINPNIYGFAFGAESDLAATNFTMNRSGGNATSTYNWQINAANRASDYYFESILDPPETPGYDGDSFIMQTRAGNADAQPLLTIPMINYLAKLGSGGATLWSFSIAKYGPQTGSDPYQPDAGNGISAANSKPITGNDPLDANTPNSVAIQRAWVQHLINTWGLAASGGLKYYIMDNEPSLWSSTHRDIHPAEETYNELYNSFVSYAGAVRALDPNALIVGPEEWSWWALFLSGLDQQNGIGANGPDYSTHNNTYYYPWLLQKLYTYQQSTGNQLLNVLSVHYYPPELSNPNDDSLPAQMIRNQSTRALWDPNLRRSILVQSSRYQWRHRKSDPDAEKLGESVLSRTANCHYGVQLGRRGQPEWGDRSGGRAWHLRAGRLGPGHPLDGARQSVADLLGFGNVS